MPHLLGDVWIVGGGWRRPFGTDRRDCQPACPQGRHQIRLERHAGVIAADRHSPHVGHRHDHDEVVEFWRAQGWERHRVDTCWTFDSREDLESVVRIEFAKDLAEEIIAEHEGTEVDYAVDVWSRAW